MYSTLVIEPTNDIYQGYKELDKESYDTKGNFMSFFCFLSSI